MGARVQEEKNSGRRQDDPLRVLALFLDIGAILAAGVLAYLVRFGLEVPQSSYIVLVAMASLLALVIFRLSNLYDRAVFSNPGARLFRPPGGLQHQEKYRPVADKAHQPGEGAARFDADYMGQGYPKGSLRFALHRVGPPFGERDQALDGDPQQYQGEQQKRRLQFLPEFDPGAFVDKKAGPPQNQQQGCQKGE